MTYLRSTLSIGALALMTLLLSACAQKADSVEAKSGDSSTSKQTLQVKDLPEAVQKTVQEQLKNAKLVAISTETEKNEILYEVELEANGHSKNLLVKATGVIAEVESGLDLSELQPGIRDAVQKAAGASKILGVEALTRNEKPFGYEVQLQDGNGKKSEIVLDVSGKVKPKEDDDEEDEDDDAKEAR